MLLLGFSFRRSLFFGADQLLAVSGAVLCGDGPGGGGRAGGVVASAARRRSAAGGGVGCGRRGADRFTAFTVAKRTFAADRQSEKFFFWRDWVDLQQTMADLPLAGDETMFVGRLTFAGWIEPRTIEYYLQLRWPRLRVFSINRNTMRYQNLFIDYCDDIAAADLLLFIADAGLESLTTNEVEAHLPPLLNDESSRRWHGQCRRALAALTSDVSLIADLPEKK
jgi:hypothetical protein